MFVAHEILISLGCTLAGFYSFSCLIDIVTHNRALLFLQLVILIYIYWWVAFFLTFLIDEICSISNSSH